MLKKRLAQWLVHSKHTKNTFIIVIITLHNDYNFPYSYLIHNPCVRKAVRSKLMVLNLDWLSELPGEILKISVSWDGDKLN